ncbi:hypothetical protein [uncultured Clostridium sp.]|uniref:peptidoglycan-binding domain-containing protein n=1 Tax=uncultured Clostridium sp. TaxID=59620 RepID=UPI0028E18A38|nr:hypothetical protein [uncultured Clostridium sp.]
MSKKLLSIMLINATIVTSLFGFNNVAQAKALTSKSTNSKTSVNLAVAKVISNDDYLNYYNGNLRFSEVRNGDKSNDVGTLQNEINEIIDKYGWSDDKLKSDSIFGDKTLKLVKKVQGYTGKIYNRDDKLSALTEDGVCGKKTWGKIFYMLYVS